MTCLPWWHNRFAPYTQNRSQVVSSGCGVDGNGNVACDPATMVASAQQQLTAAGIDLDIDLPTYTLARYIASEQGDGSPEERVAVAQAAINRVALEGLADVTSLLLYRGAHGGYYGPIYASGSTSSAPYGRWASTNLDPSLGDLMIARFVLDGGAGDFAQGADDQVGPEIWSVDQAVANTRATGQNRNYWVGPLPGVDWWRIFLTKHEADVDPASSEGQAKIAAGVAVLSVAARPDWSILDVCSRWSWAWGAGLGAAAIGGAVWLDQRNGWLARLRLSPGRLPRLRLPRRR